jgi:hypothetical protein
MGNVRSDLYLLTAKAGIQTDPPQIGRASAFLIS